MLTELEAKGLAELILDLDPFWYLDHKDWAGEMIDKLCWVFPNQSETFAKEFEGRKFPCER